MIIRLSQLAVNKTCRIISLKATVNRRRLMEIGFLPGGELRMVRAAPLGDPVIVEIMDCLIALTRAEALNITVIDE